MVRTILLGAALAFGVATAAGAMVASAPIGDAGSAVIKVAEHCGAGWWRGPDGRCHPFARRHVCPRGYHIGPEGRRCWPD